MLKKNTSIAFTVLLLTFISCEKMFITDDLTLIKESIEEVLIKDMNNPDSYSFVDMQILDTVIVKDVYLHKVQLMNDEINDLEAERNIALRSLNVISEELLNEIIYLRDILRVYSRGDELNMMNEVLTLFNNGEEWIQKLNELENYIRSSEFQTHRYRNELPNFERIRIKANSITNNLTEFYQIRINSLVEQRNFIQDYIESNEEKITEIAFFRVLFSHREQNLFGGIQLIRKMHEVRFKKDDIELMWASQNFDPNDEAFNNLSEIPYGEGMRLLKTELSLD